MTHIIKLITNVNPCDIDFDVTFCFICRFITTTCTYSHTTVLFGLLLERVIATKFAATYEKTSIIIGFGIVVTAISVAILLSYAKIHKFFLNKSMIYCSSLTFSTHLDNIAVHATLLSMLLVTIVVFAIIFIQNRNLRKRITRSINEKYQASENLRILRLMGPVLMLHFIAYPTYFAVTLIMQIVKNFIESEKFRLIYSACYDHTKYQRKISGIRKLTNITIDGSRVDVTFYSLSNIFCCYVNYANREKFHRKREISLNIFSLLLSILWYSIIQTKKHEEKDNAVFHRTAPQQENNIYFQNYTAMWN
ncbi:hypothetical protein DICVIV_12428 [Dictyocaulus viviparus]|uniref:G-protein coupled receptors family 1 profile domain-containing protein n=1 Tax=Dictyocaulus viviparus TaxID=29172 RepID=A0A0D8XCT9_DICVI|nr:hypothetical protein DICVIV_12428 [Dictyocaulus viviparus]